MTDYRVNLDIFAGPLDLLLYLVRKEEVDIYDIPISRITDQYLHYVELIKSIDMDLAGSFMVMAATLMHIKSAMLLPKTEAAQGENDTAIDPRSELIRQLLEYKKFKDAANLLDAAADEAQSRFGRPATLIEKLQPGAEPEVDIEQVSVWDLLEAFDTICKATGAGFNLNHITDETPIDLYQIEILSRLQTEGPLSFAQIFEGKANRIVLVGMFLAMLELIRYGLISIESLAEANTYRITSLTEEPPEQAVQNIIASTIQNQEEPSASGETAAVEVSAESIEPAAKSEPPIPIAELPPLSATAQQPPIPIVELPAERKPAIVREKMESPFDNSEQITN
jgi:segregation and condensation protein A